MSGRLLVTGASGLLGGRVAALAQAAGWQVSGTYYTNPVEIAGAALRPLALPEGFAELVAELRPDAVVHTAYSRRPDLLWPVVVDGSAAVARACSELHVPLIHLSSDGIFAGRQQPYCEADAPEPISPYGAAKAAAEAVVGALCPQALQVRTSLLYTPPGATRPDPNLLMAQALLQDPSRGALFTDEIRSPLCVDDLAAALVELLGHGQQGLLHIAGPEPLSRYDLGRLLLRAAGLDPSGLPAGSARDFRRPSRVVLDSGRACRMLRTVLRSPYEVLGVAYEPSA